MRAVLCYSLLCELDSGSCFLENLTQGEDEERLVTDCPLLALFSLAIWLSLLSSLDLSSHL